MKHLPIICLLAIALAPYCTAMDKDVNNTDLIQKLPTCLKDHGLKYPDDLWIRHLTQLLTIPEKKLVGHEIRTEVNKKVGLISGDWLSMFPQLSPYTVDRLAKEMKELVLDKKPVPNLPYNQDIEEQNNLFFARHLPEPFATELGDWIARTKSSPVHRRIACCMYALCKRITPEDDTNTSDDPVLQASGCNALTLKEYTLLMLNQYKHIGCKLGKEPTEQHCQTIIKLFYGNYTVLRATQTINKYFNRYWHQTHEEPELEFARSTLIAIHKQLHETILKPDLSLNEEFADKGAIKKMFIEQLKKLPLILRKNDNVITLCAPKFDEVPLIKDYDKNSLALVPPCPYPKKRKSLLPPSIVYCLGKSSDTATKDELIVQSFILGQNTELTKKVVIDALKNCMGYVHLSPQTYFGIKQAFLHLVHGTEINMRDQRLNTDNQLQEIQNKLRVVERLPLILRDLLVNHRYDDPYTLHKIINPFYKYAQGITWHKKNGLFPIYRVIENHNNTQNAWYFRAISPQTAIKILKNYTNGKPGKPYNIQKEIDKFTEIIKDFPAELWVDPKSVFDNNKPELWKLCYIAYQPRAPVLEIVMGCQSHNIEKLIKKIYKRSRYESGTFSLGNINFATITEKFEKIFKLSNRTLTEYPHCSIKTESPTSSQQPQKTSEHNETI